MRRDQIRRAGRKGAAAVLLTVTAALALALSASAAGAVGTLDQAQEGPSDFTIGVGNASDTDTAQIFTAGITGDLDQVDLFLGFPPEDPRPAGALLVGIYNVVNGMPGVPIVSAVVHMEDVPAEGMGWVAVPIDPAVPVTAGTQYAIVAVGSSEIDQRLYLWSATDGDVYAAGAPAARQEGSGTWVDPGGLDPFDFNFRTYVTPTSPPPPPPQQQCSLIRLSLGLGLGPPIVICL